MASPGPPDFEAAYLAAREEIARATGAARDRPRHRIVCVRDGVARLVHTIFADPVWDAFVVVGRHRRCGVVLDGDRAIGSRHLFARSMALPSGRMAIRLLDLQTGRGFSLVDGSRQTSVVAEGPVVIALGERVLLVALPEGTRGPRLPRVLPRPAIVDSSDEHDAHVEPVRRLTATPALSAPPAPPAMSPYRANARSKSSSQITLMPRIVMVGASDRPSRNAPAAFTITLERDGLAATVRVTETDLAAGVLIGRSAQCSELLRRITDERTSRVHVLILREARSTYAYDLASTFGIFHDGVPARSVALGRASNLTLGGGKLPLRLIWRTA